MENPQAAEPVEIQGGALQSLWGVLLAPEKTFRALAARPTWLPAMLLTVLSAFLLSMILVSRMDLKGAILEAIEKKGLELTASQLDLQVSIATAASKYSPLLIQPIFLLLAAVLFLVVLRLLGSEIDFRRSLSVTVHGMMPLVLAALLTIPVALSRAQVSMQDVKGSRLLSSNLAVFAPDSVGSVTLALLSSIDVFTIWTVVLLAIGFRIVARLSAAAAWGTVLTFWLLAVGLKLGMAALS
jgi:hypothetical protein